MESLLADARDHEEKYQWREASDVYGKLVRQPVVTAPQRADIQEKLAYGLYRWARQASKVEEFRDRAAKATKAYQEAQRLYDLSDNHTFRGLSLRCQAVASYLASRTSAESSEKKRMVEAAWELTKKSLEILARSGKAEEYARTYNELVEEVGLLANLEQDYVDEERTLMEAFELGQKSIGLLSAEFPLELSKSYVITAGWMEGIGYTVLRDPEEQNRYHQNARSYWKTAMQLSEETALLNLAVGGPDLGLGSNESLDALRKALGYARRTGDKQVIGATLEGLSLHTSWKALGSEDPEEATRLLKEALTLAEEARNEYDALSFTSWGPPVLWIGSPYADYYRLLARYETNIEKRRDLLEKSLEAAPDQLRRTIEAGYPYATSTAHHVFTTALTSLAGIERDRKRKLKLLEEALEHSSEYIRIIQQLEPYNYWNQGEGQDTIAHIKSELARLSDDPDQETRLLQEAIQAKKASLTLSNDAMRWVESAGSASLISQIASKNFQYADLLTRSRGPGNNHELLRNASEAFEKAALLYDKAGQPSRAAECYWRSSQAYDLSEDNQKASDNFALASNNYKIAGEKLPQLEGFYQDHATYMRAWSEIERGRYHHGRQEYRLAREDYEKAAELHKLTKTWSYLTKNYSAWAELEGGEDLSRSDKPGEAIQAFERAATLFAGSRMSIQQQLGQIKEVAESQMAGKLIKASELRRDYCNGRITLEEAKILDKKGDHLTSSEKFGLAAEILAKIAGSVEFENERLEFRLIITLSNAWRLMAKAEVEESPVLYAEASKLFEEAKELSPTERSKTLALGHSRFCKALESATRFAETRNLSLQRIAIQSLENAAYYYLRADEPKASEYARATKLVFEANSYMDEAINERDLEKKSLLYLMAENMLKASAMSYSKADHPEKEDQVRRLLEKTRQDRDLAHSIALVFRAPAIMSDTNAFSTPKPTQESAVGLERFEHADIQMRTRAEPINPTLGEEFTLQLELANAGRGVAQIVKIEEVIPMGFELKESPLSYRAEGSSLNMKGKRLDPLKVEDLRVVLRPTNRGRFTLKPRIVYLDENGQERSHEPIPLDVTVDRTAPAGRPSLEPERRLAAIMFTDIEGYTSLTEKDERLAIELLEEHRRLLRLLFPNHNGREIKTIGDSFLVEFASALEAVRCGIQIQTALSRRNFQRPEDKRISLRIGIHVGDVEHREGDVYGDAVNIASRIEPLAEPGGIIITRQVYDQIRNRPDLKTRPLGNRELKNVKEPVEIFSISSLGRRRFSPQRTSKTRATH